MTKFYAKRRELSRLKIFSEVSLPYTETLKVCFPFVNLRISKKTFRVFHERNVR